MSPSRGVSLQCPRLHASHGGLLTHYYEGTSSLLSHLVFHLISHTQPNGPPVGFDSTLLACIGLFALSALGHPLAICRDAPRKPGLLVNRQPGDGIDCARAEHSTHLSLTRGAHCLLILISVCRLGKWVCARGWPSFP